VTSRLLSLLPSRPRSRAKQIGPLPSAALTTAIMLLSIFGLTTSGCGETGDGIVTPPPPVVPVVTMSAEPAASGDAQSGTVATTLPLPLRVVVDSDGSPQAGVTVTWQSSSGALAPTSSVTDAEGLATTMWTLDTVSGGKTASAAVAGAEGSPVTFSATALAGPATIIEKMAGDSQAVAANRPPFNPLLVRFLDQYRNRVEGRTVTWSVESGPLTILSSNPMTNGDGVSLAVVGTQRTPGGGLVRVALNGATLAVDFTLTVGPPEAFVVVEDQGRSTFTSAQNHTSNPAVDTLAVGQTMAFNCTNFDYGQHRLVSVGQPSFGRQDFPYGCLSEPLSVTFTAPGTYQYADFYFRRATGTIVVE
jgi:plastocyanin